MEFRYYNVYTKIGLYKGRLVALKMLYKKSLEITRKIKKELKMVFMVVSSMNCAVIFQFLDEGSQTRKFEHLHGSIN